MKLSDTAIRAILPLQGATYIWVVADDKASRREVETGVRRPGFVEVRSGIAVGDHVVVGGLERLFDGASVAPRITVR